MATASSELDYQRLCRETDPWASIPARYNLGHALTRGNVDAGLGSKICLRWENSRGETRRFTYAEMDEASSRLASALARKGVKPDDRVLLRLPNLPEFYVAALGIAKLGAPVALGGILIAMVVFTPECIAALKAITANQLQRAINLCLGAAAPTLGLTVPAVLVIGLITGQEVVLGLSGTNMVILSMTLLLSTLTFTGTRTTMLEGAVHLSVFFVFLVLVFSP